MTTACLSNEQLHQMLDEESQSYPIEFSEHLAECQTCQQRLLDTVGADELPTAALMPGPHQGQLSELIERIVAQPAEENPNETLVAPTHNVATPVLDTLGHYEIIRWIGRGGFADVYLARDPNLDRQVAIKVSNTANLRRPEAFARFRREAQAAGMLSHPQIVPVYETGQIEDVSYIAFEYCPGQDLAKWFVKQDRRVPTRQAAEIVGALAEAVQHAHQRGIVHRDLKPSNVLVDERHPDTPLQHRLRITDFGLALRQLVEDQTLTAEGTVLGTPAYMSPEQATDSKNVDKLSDIYSLGVMLYELLCGDVPIRKETQLATLRALENEVPQPLRVRQSDVPADLEAICAKCLQKRPEDRFASAYALADDLRAWLEGRPIKARPIPAWQRLGRWAKRNTALAASLAIAFVGLLAGLSMALYSARQERVSNRQAQARLSQIENGMGILAGIFRDLDIRDTERNDQPVEAMLANRLVVAGQQLDEDAIGDPLIVADLRSQLATSLIALGFAEDAVELAELSFETHADLLGENDPKTMATRFVLATALINTGALHVGLRMHREILERRESVLTEDDPETLFSMNSVAHALELTGQIVQAVELYETTLEKKEQILGENDPSTLSSMNNLASGYLASGHLHKALPLFEETYERRIEVLSIDHPDTMTSADQLANALLNDKQTDRALTMLEGNFARRTERLAADHPATLTSMSSLASGYRATGQIDKALQLFEKVLELRRGKLGDYHPHTVASMNNLAVTYANTGEAEKALPLIEEAYSVFEQKLDVDHPSTLTTMSNVAGTLYKLGRHDQSFALLEKALRMTDEKLGPEHPDAIDCINLLTAVLQNTGNYEKACLHLPRLIAARRKSLGDDAAETLETIANLGTCYLWSGQADKSLPHLEEALAVDESVPDWLYYREALREAYGTLGLVEKFEVVADSDLVRYRQLPEQSESLAKKLGLLGLDYLRVKNYEKARLLLAESLTIRESLGLEDWRTANVESALGEALLGQEDFEAAEPLLRRGYEGLIANRDSIHISLRLVRLNEAVDRLIQFYETKDDAAKAQTYQLEKSRLLQ